MPNFRAMRFPGPWLETGDEQSRRELLLIEPRISVEFGTQLLNLIGENIMLVEDISAASIFSVS